MTLHSNPLEPSILNPPHNPAGKGGKRQPRAPLPDETARAAQALLDQLTEAASALMDSGELDIYAMRQVGGPCGSDGMAQPAGGACLQGCWLPGLPPTPVPCPVQELLLRQAAAYSQQAPKDDDMFADDDDAQPSSSTQAPAARPAAPAAQQAVGEARRTACGLLSAWHTQAYP